MTITLNRPLLQKHLPSLLQLADVFDQSFSFSASGAEYRVLLGWYTPNAPMDILSNLFIDWGIPSKFVQQWRLNTPDTEGVGISFNQDLSSWCVSLIPSLPSNFDTGATSWVLLRPVWGTCPP